MCVERYIILIVRAVNARFLLFIYKITKCWYARDENISMDLMRYAQFLMRVLARGNLLNEKRQR